MKKLRICKAVCLLFAIAFLLPLFPLRAKAVAPAPEIQSAEAILYNIEYDKILYEKAADSRIYPAAFTKLMTALIAYEFRSANGNITVSVTQEMLSGAGGTSMGLKVGEQIPLDSLLAGLIVFNANDAAVVIASAVSGSVSAFVERMNARAGELGMANTYYANPTGVDSSIMYSTVRDTLTLCRTLYRINDFMTLSAVEEISIPATNVTGARNYTNKNALMPYSYVLDYCLGGARGMIAGFTGEAGYCVATTRQKKLATNLVIVSGGVDSSEKQNGSKISSYYDARHLLEWAEEGYAVTQIAAENEIVCEKKVSLANGQDHMILITGGALSQFLPADFDKASPDFSVKIVTESDSFTAPIVKGQVYGTAEYYYQNELIGSVPLVAQTNISRSSWLTAWNAVVRFFSNGPAKVILILVILCAVLYVVILISVVLIQNARQNREKHLAMLRLEEKENRRLDEVRRRERLERGERIRRAGTFLHEGFKVLSGEAEIVSKSPRKEKPGKAAPQSRAVARVPEKYRKNPAAPSGNPRRPQAPAARQAQGNPAARQPQRNPAQRQTQGNPAARQPQGNPATRQPQGNPAARQAQGNPAARQAQGNPAVRQSQGNPTARQPQGNPAQRQAQGNPAARRAPANNPGQRVAASRTAPSAQSPCSPQSPAARRIPPTQPPRRK